MKYLVHCFIVFFFLMALPDLAYDLKDFEKQFKLIPQPKKVELLQTKGIAANALQSIWLKGTTDRPVLYGLLNELPLAKKEGPGVITLNLSTDNGVPESDEGYT